MEKEKDELIKQLTKANKLLGREVSPSYQFYLSIIRGIGTAIGLTLIGGIVIGVLNSFVNSIYDIPILGKIIGDLQYLFSPRY